MEITAQIARRDNYYNVQAKGTNVNRDYGFAYRVAAAKPIPELDALVKGGRKKSLAVSDMKDYASISISCTSDGIVLTKGNKEATLSAKTHKTLASYCKKL